MKQANLFSKTFKEVPKDEKSVNAQLLIRAGFVDKLASGVFIYLPLGLRTLKKIQNIVIQEMNKIGGQEILMPSLTPKQNWEKTGRVAIEEAYKIQDEDFILGWTHEEIITPLMVKHLLSSKDLPKAIYQIQTKFRNEPRAKSGLLRAREFIMKDMYSFHNNIGELDVYYERVKESYFNIFSRCGLKEKTYLTLASGGAFTEKYSHEFQTITEAGEDIIYICEQCGLAMNKEIKTEKCVQCGADKFIEKKSIEVGNIFKLNTKYSEPFGLKNEKGEFVLMGCYGLGITRLMGAVVEVFNDEKGIIWPKNIAPFQIHLLELAGKNKEVKEKCKEVYEILQKNNFEVLYDDRDEKTAGEKLADSDLIGLPLRMVISQKTLEQDSVEVKNRNEENVSLIKISEIIKYAEKFFR
ncbi:MAG TPA: His/Gly/Thr/Pro-type tRNA ligase C-terminal domain-containing protein [Candidatus Pacearchaeota archaeon]|nr:His/Gly/Thr/Pro-type tRNA ligase C-terminal domain-containing protein [Candidatus Pacearchaeota archaeon]HQH20194.1 His/Gly/Thr/Pro-type tRNA ligase C-terminal domain-containing protein [Candidatus Pacearchaeota archaeon]HRU20870.1 His/Gly/Thr/Pro-type tRNA ligase C-terminal domain-containing protein [Candidatus Paceibacterota bacterium]